MRTYTLWAPTRGFASLNNRPPRWRESRESWYRIEVRAYSIKQAYYVAANRIHADGPGTVGITEIRPPTRDVAPVGSVRGDEYVRVPASGGEPDG